MIKTTYADIRNSKFSNTESHICSIEERWNETYKNLTTRNRDLVDQQLELAYQEFHLRNPQYRSWNQLKLAKAYSAPMNSIKIDGTMQRQLDIMWVKDLLNKFMATAVVPIQVYCPDPSKEEYLAWDGQHTLVLLWIIATKIFGEDPNNIIIPVNVYASSLKSEMRANFITLNSDEGKKQLEKIDLWEQKVFGVRIDGSENPDWMKIEQKQRAIEKFGLFVTSSSYGDDEQPGAISRLHELESITVKEVGWLSEYLSHSTGLRRPVEEKEIVMMSRYFELCRLENISIDSNYIAELSSLLNILFKGDFSPSGLFWNKVRVAYLNWHAQSGSESGTYFTKEPKHGIPFLIAQLNKTFNRAVPLSKSTSDFTPLMEDLFYNEKLTLGPT
jgi:hypothetical protein